MDRDEFMDLVYETFADEPDNVLANGIIEAADAYVEHEKAQLSNEDATFDLIDRQQAIDALDFEIVHMIAYCDGENEGNPLAQYNKGLEDGKKAIEALPSAQPDYTEMKQEFLRMASYIDVLLECSDEQKETLLGFISRMSEFMPWTQED